MGTSWSKLWEMVTNRESWHAAVHGVAKSQKGRFLKQVFILHLCAGDRAREALPIRWTFPLHPPLSLCCYAQNCPHL